MPRPGGGYTVRIERLAPYELADSAIVGDYQTAVDRVERWCPGFEATTYPPGAVDDLAFVRAHLQCSDAAFLDPATVPLHDAAAGAIPLRVISASGLLLIEATPGCWLLAQQTGAGLHSLGTFDSFYKAARAM